MLWWAARLPSERFRRPRLALLPLAAIVSVLGLAAALWPSHLDVNAAPVNGPSLVPASGDVPPAFVACGPRPGFHLDTIMALDGRQRVTVSAGSGQGLNSLTFGTPRPLQNARIDIGTMIGQAGPFTFTLPPSSIQIQFMIRPIAQSSTPVTVPFVVNDTCGTSTLR